jgi:hypothetical protein
MKIQSYRRLFKGDFPRDQQEMVERLSSTLNIGIETLYTALNKNISLKDNIYGTYKEISYVPTSDGTPETASGFQIDFNGRVLGLQVIRVENKSSVGTYPTGGVFITYSQNGTQVNIDHITGLVAGDTYNIRVFAFGE